MKRKSRILAVFLVMMMALGGCAGKNSPETPDESASGGNTDISAIGNENSGADEYFSDRDFETDYDESKSAVITLNGDSASCSLDAVQISGSTITITDEGTYILSGTLEDGMIIVDTEKTDKTQLVLDGAEIHSETSAAIYIRQSDKVFITTAAGTTNTLSNGGTFTAIDDNNIDAVIFSKEDLTLNGAGTLVITSPAGHGIVSKDSLRLASGSYDINCASQGLSGKDEVCIADGDFTIVSGKDGIHSENEDDDTCGYVYIQNGTFSITAEGDGISAAAYMLIENGTFAITSGGGSANAASKSSGSWGDFMGGGRHQGMKNVNPADGNNSGMGTPGAGDSGTGNPGAGDAGTAAEDESTSMKGIKAASALIINGGAFTIDSADDSVHSNGSVTVNGGTFEIASGDDAFHGDDTLTIADGTIQITESYEGLEALHVVISGGEITLTADDDGINAAGGTDSSGTTGGRDGMFGGGFGGKGGMGGAGGMSSSSDGSIVISGGTISVTASGDGIDANGTLEITGGYTVVCGPTQGDTATLDYDVSAVITGGTFIGTGASGMAQTFSSSEQGVVAANLGNVSEGTEVSLLDSDGNTVITYTPQLSYQVVIVSSPDLVTGETYTVTAGSASGEVTAK